LGVGVLVFQWPKKQFAKAMQACCAKNELLEGIGN